MAEYGRRLNTGRNQCSIRDTGWAEQWGKVQMQCKKKKKKNKNVTTRCGVM